MILLSRIREPDDDEAWRRFANLYGPLIFRYCRERGLQEADALDVTQTVLANVSRSIGNFEYDRTRGRFRNWLGVIARREIQKATEKARRAGKGTGGGEHDYTLDGICGGVDAARCDEFNSHIYHCALQRAQAAVDDLTWLAFELTWIHDVKPSHIARRTGKPISWVYKAKFRVLQRIKREVLFLASDAPIARGDVADPVNK